MDEVLTIHGGKPLFGKVPIEGAKNSALPIMAASLLAGGEVELLGVPPLEDVRTMAEVLRSLGCGVENVDGQVKVFPRALERFEAPYEHVRKMRASLLVMGSSLARVGRARMALPGGCAIGVRPIDLHLKGLCVLGAKVTARGGLIEIKAPDGLIGGRVYLDWPSVGATENIMMAACLARGYTYIENAAEEPEIVDLANFLNAMGARVQGAGTNVIRIEGVARLQGTRHTIIPDRIEAGTYLIAGAITGGEISVTNVIPEHLKAVVAKLREAGAEVEEGSHEIGLRMRGRPRATDIRTMPYPGFPTDMQSQMMALVCLADGCSVVTETVFENRFMHVEELKRMGANIKIEGRSAVVRGVKKLSGAPVKATDLRAGAGLVLAALAADGRSEVCGLAHLDRGYAHLVPKLKALGAAVERTQRDVPATR
ncbi:MAG TPA: UDP-N-acetylglucosamine 1-carboxyvinyltransferase [Firmicutes bacterium]|nr:UDP-N-acetylglucosamine 1-carboxyvinyltransferase [Bacillota bacterium]